MKQEKMIKKFLVLMLSVIMAISVPTMTQALTDKDSGTNGLKEVNVQSSESVIVSDNTMTQIVEDNLDEGIALADLDDQDVVTEENGVAYTESDDGTKTYYLTLQDAVNQAADGQTVTLIKDIELLSPVVVRNNKTITLELNGCSVKRGSGNTTSYLIGVVSGATLTIQDHTGSGKIYSSNYTAVDSSDGQTYTYAGYGVLTNGTLKIESGNIEGYYAVYVSGEESQAFISGGTITGSYTGIVTSKSKNVTISNGNISGARLGINANLGTVNITGGTIKATEKVDESKGIYPAVIQANGCTLNISEESGNNTLLEGEYGINIFNSPYGGKNPPYGNGSDAISCKVTVSGGTINASNGFALSGNCNRSAGTEVAISGGSFNAPNTTTAIYWPMEGTLDISGGTITGGTGIEVKMGTLRISGGTITGTASYVEGTPMNGGSSPEGSALLVTAQMYGGSSGQYINSSELNVNITGGNLISNQGNAITTYKVALKNNTEPQDAKVTVSGANTKLESASGILVKVISDKDQKINNDNNGITTISGNKTSITVTYDIAEAIVDTLKNADGTENYLINYYESKAVADEVAKSDQNAEQTPVTGVEAKIGNVYYSTVQEAIEAAKENDTIIILSGSHQLTIDKHIVVSNNGEGSVTINGSVKVTSGNSVVIHNAKKVAAKAPTATEAGNIEYWYCQSCGKYFSDEALTKEIKKEDTVIAATGKPEESTTATDKPAQPVVATNQILLPKVKASKTSNKLTWNKLKDADGYYVYAAKCNTKKKKYSLKKVKEIKSAKTVTFTHKKLKKNTWYKYQVAAYKKINGKKVIIGRSLTMHSLTTGSKVYSNPSKVTVSKTKISLKKGKTATIKAKMTLPKKKKTKNHVAKIRYIVSDKTICTVSASGKIKAKKKGTCTVYAVSQNGISKKIKVTVK